MQQEIVRRERGKVEEDPYFEQLQNLLATGPTSKPEQIIYRIDAPNFNDDDGSDDYDGISDTNVKPMGIEEFKQRIENERLKTKETNPRKGRG